MSEWIDLQLAHSLAPAKAPAALWGRIDAALCPAPVRPAPRGIGAFRWAVPCAVAAVVLLLLVRTTAIELRGHAEFASNDPVAVEHWLAHEAGIPVPLRPAPGVRITGARVERPGVATVAYMVDGRPETITISRGAGAAPGALPGRGVLFAANAARSDASCKMCHSL
jgi:hypothetical protein